MRSPSFTRTWPSLAEAPALYPDARNRINRGPLLYRAGKCFPLSSRPDAEGRVPLLAAGSNGYPRQLQDKLSGTLADLQGVPLIPAILTNFDVAFCPIRSRKGYVPVTLSSRPGAISLTWLQWLTLEQLNIISATEGSRYALAGGPELSARVQTPTRWQAPRTLYAWWFDSLLVRDHSPIWLDVYRRQGDQQRALAVDDSDPRLNPIPDGWQVVPRDPISGQIEAEIMSQMC